MNAYLMAAGNGMRLRPLTDNFQKCLLLVGGKPMLAHWLDAVFKSYKFKSVSVNLHHYADQVEAWLATYMCETGFIPRTINERSGLLGTAGTLFWHAEPGEEIMVAYTDTYSEELLTGSGMKRIIQKWNSRKKECIAGLVAFEAPKDRSSGRIGKDAWDTVVSFDEKGSDGRLAWAGMMFAAPEFFSELRREDRDIARDVLPRLCGRMKVIDVVDAYDIGRGPEHYAELSRRL